MVDDLVALEQVPKQVRLPQRSNGRLPREPRAPADCAWVDPTGPSKRETNPIREGRIFHGVNGMEENACERIG